MTVRKINFNYKLYTNSAGLDVFVLAELERLILKIKFASILSTVNLSLNYYILIS